MATAGSGGHRSSGHRQAALEPQARREALWAYAFLSPAFFFLIVLVLFPILFAFWISLHDWSLIPREFPLIGLNNYIEALKDPLTIKSLKNTVVYTIGAVPVGMSLALILALIMNQDRLPVSHALPNRLLHPGDHVLGGGLVRLGLDVRAALGPGECFLGVVRHHGASNGWPPRFGRCRPS